MIKKKDRLTSIQEEDLDLQDLDYTPDKKTLLKRKSNGATSDSSEDRFSQIYVEERYRWIVLLIFSLGSGIVGIVWETLIPIASTLQKKEGLSWTYINMYTIVFFIVFIPLNFPTNYLIEKRGLRIAVVLGLLFSTAGSWMRVAFNSSLSLALAGQTLACFAGPVFLNAPSKLAAVWFKPGSRTLATNIAAGANIVGSGVGALIPVWFVKSGANYRSSQITTLMIVEASMASLLFLIALIFFKNKPYFPPSPAAEADRLGFSESVKLMFTSCNFLVLTLSVFCSQGSGTSFAAVIQEIFSHYGYSNPHTYSSLLSCLMFVIGFLGSLVIAMIADKTKKLKLILIITNFLSAAAIGLFTWLVDLRNKWLSGLIICIYGCFNISTVPLSLELATEITYPVGESNSGGVVMTASQLSSIALTYTSSALFDSSSFQSTKSAMTSNLINFGLSCLGVVAALLVKENYKRSRTESEITSSFIENISVSEKSVRSQRLGS